MNDSTDQPLPGNGSKNTAQRKSMADSSELVQMSSELIQGSRRASSSTWRFLGKTIGSTVNALQNARPASILLTAFAVLVLYLFVLAVAPDVIGFFESLSANGNSYQPARAQIAEVRQYQLLNAFLNLTKYSSIALAGWALMRLLSDAIREGHNHD